jgi:hypothetical protein
MKSKTTKNKVAPPAQFPATKTPKKVVKLHRVRDIDTREEGTVLKKVGPMWKVKWDNRQRPTLIDPDQLAKANPKRKRFVIIVKVKQNKGRKKVAGKKDSKQNPQQLLTPAQLDHLRAEFGKLDHVDLTKYRGAFQEVFAGVRTPLLRQLAKANIEWVSPLARNAFMRRQRNPKANPMHPLEVGSHVAIILSGLEQVRNLIRRARPKRRRTKNGAKKNLGLISLVENLQAAEYLKSKLGRKKRNPESPALGKPIVIMGTHFVGIITKKAGEKVMVQIYGKNGSLVQIKERPFTLFRTVPGARKWARAQVNRLDRADKNPKSNRKKPARRAANPNNGKLFEKFTGKKSEFVETGYMWPAPAPKNVDQLGRLTELHLSNPGEQVNISKCGRGHGPCHCARVLRFASNPAKLCATQPGSGKPRFVIGLKKRFAMPRELNPSVPHDYGEVHTVVYEAKKPHLYGHDRMITFYHDLGEEGGRRPHLILENGLLKLRGGDYTIEREGIRN